MDLKGPESGRNLIRRRVNLHEPKKADNVTKVIGVGNLQSNVNVRGHVLSRIKVCERGTPLSSSATADQETNCAKKIEIFQSP